MLKQVNHIPGAKRQLGFTLAELVAVTAIAGMTAVSLGWIAQRARAEQTSTGAAMHMKAVGIAVDNFTAKYAYELRLGSAVAGVANPYAPTIQELGNLGMLPVGFTATRLPGGNMTTLIERVPAGCSGETCDLTWTTYPVQPFLQVNGQPDEATAGAVVRAIGTFAGYSPVSNPAVFRGYNDSWNPGVGVPNPTGQAAVVAMKGGYGSSVMAKFLRIDGGNQMTGNLRVGGHDIVDANDAAFSGNVDVTGAQINRSTLRVMGAQTNDSTLAVASSATIGGAASVGGTLGVGGQATMYSNMRVVGNQTNDRSLTVGEYMQSASAGPAQYATLDTSCAGFAQGSFKNDAAGKLLSCQAGLWKVAGGSSGGKLSGTITSNGSYANQYLYTFVTGSPGTQYQVYTYDPWYGVSPLIGARTIPGAGYETVMVSNATCFPKTVMFRDVASGEWFGSGELPAQQSCG